MHKLGLLIVGCSLAVAACHRVERSAEPPQRAAAPAAGAPTSSTMSATAPGGDSVLVAAPAAPPVDDTGELDCFTPIHLVDIPEWASLIDTADVDGDGRPDVLASYDVFPTDGSGSKPAEYVTVFGGDGRGDFARGHAHTLGSDFTYSMDLGDIDRDGNVDLVLNSYRDRRILVLAGRGDGTFDPRADIATQRKPGDVTLADMDGDGRLDLVVTYFAHVRTYRGDGAFGFTPQKAFAVDQAPEAPIIADFDGDGDRDIAIVSNDRNTFFLLQRGADGGYDIAPRGATCASPAYAYGGDFNRDGAMDVAYPCGDGQIEVRTNDGAGNFAVHQLSAPHVEYLAGGDFTGDGIIDLLAMGRAGAFTGSDLYLFAGDGAGSFEQRSTHHVDGTLSTPAVTDVDGDGRVDIVAALWPGTEPGHVAVLRSTRCRSR